MSSTFANSMQNFPALSCTCCGERCQCCNNFREQNGVLRGENAAHRVEMDSLRVENNALAGIVSAKEAVKAAKDENQTITGLEFQIVDYKVYFAKAFEKINRLETTVAANSAEIAANRTEMAANRTEMAANRTEIGRLNDLIVTERNANTEEIGRLNDLIVTEWNANQEQIGRLNQRIGTLENDKLALAEKVETLRERVHAYFPFMPAKLREAGMLLDSTDFERKSEEEQEAEITAAIEATRNLPDDTMFHIELGVDEMSLFRGETNSYTRK